MIILAGGRSSRLGKPKQLIVFRGASLVVHAVRTAIDSGASDVVVVLGAYAEQVKAVLVGLAVRVVENPSWEKGMSSSIKAGIDALPPKLGRAILMNADQPLLPPEHIRQLAGVEGDMAASSYDGVLGTPCLFGRSLFPALMALAGDSGAKALIRSANPVSISLNGEASLDIDTLDDLNALNEY